MTILRSREIPSVSGKPPSNRRSQIIQPSTPVRTQEPTFHHSPNEPTLDGSGSTNTFRRRSPRLSLNGFTEKEVSVSICSKRKSNVGEKFLNLRSGKRVAKRSVENGVEIDSIHVSLSDDSKERKSGNESKRKRVCVDLVEEDNSGDDAVVIGDIMGDTVRKVEALVVESKNNGKGIVEDSYQVNGDDAVVSGHTVRKIEALVDGSENKGKGIAEDSYQVNGGDAVVSGDIVGVTVRKIEALVDESKNKGKGIVEDSYEVNDVEMKCVESCERPSSSVGRRKYTREEKGKGIQVENVSPLTTNETTGVGVEEMEIESLINNQKSPEASGAELSAAANAEQTQNHENGNASKNQHFRDIAKKNASRFAHFDAESEGEEESSDKEGEQVEDWPGPFSTAMKIIKDREDNTSLHNDFSFSNTEKSSPIIWVPRRNNSFLPPRAPSLQELSLRILVKNSDAITSLDYVPDALRVKLCQLLCDSRRMDVHFLDLLVRGSPTGICVPDCSWLTEEQFTECFKNCDTSNLMVLQLDQCGRCMPDYVLPSTLARSPKNLPVLSSLSLSGACRLTDVGLRALVSAAPTIRSINLSQCSLLTSSSIDMLSDSLGSVLSELYLNECQGIDLKLILSALKMFEKLEVLSLVDLPSVRGRFLKEFVIARGQALKQLILTNSVKLTDTSVKDISENCPNLSVLDLANVCKLTDRALGYLANGCQALEKLIFCRNSFSDEAVAIFVETAGDSLMELSLNNVKKVGHNTASALAKLSAKLQILDVSWCRDMSDHSLGYIVDNCSSLKVLKVFGCTQITDVFIQGHSNPNVKILGLKMSPFLNHLTKNLADS